MRYEVSFSANIFAVLQVVFATTTIKLIVNNKDLNKSEQDGEIVWNKILTSNNQQPLQDQLPLLVKDI